MIDLAAVAARINALPGWKVVEFRDPDGEHYTTVLSDWEGWAVIVFDDGRVEQIDLTGDKDLMKWLPVLQIVAEAMPHE